MTRNRRVVGALAGVVALSLTLSLGACSKDKPDLPSVGGETVGAPGASGDLVATAKTFHDCLTDAQLPATYSNDTNGRPTIVTFDKAVKALGVFPDGNAFANEGTTKAEQQDFFQGRDMSKPVLQVDGVDQTDAWTSCLTKSGYNVGPIFEAVLGSPLGLSMFTLSVDASNKWAQCARDNGFPETKDAIMPTKYDLSQVPAALLPPSITEPQLTDLLTKCPAFDAEQQKKSDALLDKVDTSDPTKIKIPDGYVMQPTIGFDYPGFDGQGGSLTSGPAPKPNDDTSKRLDKLRTIIDQPYKDYTAGKLVSVLAPSATP